MAAPADTTAPTTASAVEELKDDAPVTAAEAASGSAVEMSGALPQISSDNTDNIIPAKGTCALLRVSEALLNQNSAPEASSDAPATESVSKPVESATSAAPPVAAVDAAAQEDEPVKETTDLAPETSNTAAEEPVLEANGNPVTRKGSNGKRKSGAVPEHKNKKLNKKKSMPKITHLDAKPGDYFLARLKSYPPWPSIICDEEILPEVLLSTRPVTTKKADGTYNEAYADGGKKVADRTFPVMFLGTNEL
jgi:hypothetical protein